jgi:hypothetical protein
MAGPAKETDRSMRKRFDQQVRIFGHFLQFTDSEIDPTFVQGTTDVPPVEIQNSQR